ncbi:hypothetical protein [Rhizobium leguminosarum]|uniref:hypothetical protein n=1 Tax=Rhizobium leguminosarum TaxID=384 RepID=UPI001C974334|nr:hypothetical protein [Rhizobium leguminosarum]MBY5657132.1 hypothetical protein [Rhizobium leguminosarum]
MMHGIRQLQTLRAVGTTAAIVVPDSLTRRLCALGLMASEASGSFAHITPAGLRALADAVDAGRISLFVMPEKKAPVDKQRGNRG